MKKTALSIEKMISTKKGKRTNTLLFKLIDSQNLSYVNQKNKSIKEGEKQADKGKEQQASKEQSKDTFEKAVKLDKKNLLHLLMANKLE